jgi:predicted dehydrogenase
MKVTVVIVGYGDRGSIYANYAAQYPEELEVVAVVDPDPFRMGLAKEKFHLKDEQCISDFNDLLARGKIADCAVVATMDQLHYEQATALLKQNYHMLLEKPVVNNAAQLEEKLRTLLFTPGLAERYSENCRHAAFETPESYYEKLMEIYAG